MSSLKLFCAATAALGLGISPITWADIADTDTGFGTTGVTTTDLGSNFDQSGDVFVGANDRIYSVAIDSSSASPAPGTVTKYFIARYSAAGVLDSSFGTGGQITVPVSVLPYAGAVFLAVDEANQKIYLYVKGPAGCPRSWGSVPSINRISQRLSIPDPPSAVTSERSVGIPATSRLRIRQRLIHPAEFR